MQNVKFAGAQENVKIQIFSLMVIYHFIWKFITNLSFSIQNFMLQLLQPVFKLVKVIVLWRCGIVVIPTGKLNSTKPELRFCAGLCSTCGMSEILDGEDLRQWSRLEIRLIAFFQSIIPQKQFIIISIQNLLLQLLQHIFELVKVICYFVNYSNKEILSLGHYYLYQYQCKS